ncbi:Retrotrans gag domain-containing protein [Abeliophyllum distichum]|uniref:Retrotrans gag domain-containing protein n=1 Tax=Abeliophyllum distichum TaxID=126358 RepID=A0ABD1RU31_9LAMI
MLKNWYPRAIEITTTKTSKELLIGFNMPPMEKYNERGDPIDHINVYKTRLQGFISVVKYRNFQTTIVSDMKRWCNKLKPRSIRSWPQLKLEFINGFIGNRTTAANVAQLHDVRQKEGEYVKSYSECSVRSSTTWQKAT